MRELVRTAAGALALAAGGALLYSMVLRPRYLRWGASQEEAEGVLPGDECLSGPQLQSTRAVTINVPAREVWPWLVQIGQGRGGLYSYDWLENLVGCDIHSVDRMVPELQRLRIGDAVHLGPEGYPFFTVMEMIPDRALVLAAGDAAPAQQGAPSAMAANLACTWAFVLHPVNNAVTRLLVRFRARWSPGLLATAGNRVLLEPAHFVMERKMLLGIKKRAEKGKGSACCSTSCVAGTACRTGQQTG